MDTRKRTIDFYREQNNAIISAITDMNHLVCWPGMSSQDIDKLEEKILALKKMKQDIDRTRSHYDGIGY